ncbi:venom serine protease-like [Bradysia coprophila]|uniref:venom serine protease-like n=1 Tax=Bradysia coprophila TaxID=38358 RepID=UPI00187D8B6D|nr:venom serine protease-like [Bradysia coprophila]
MFSIKMDWCKVSVIIVLLNVFGICQAYFEACDSTINVDAGQTISLQSPGYSAGYGYAPGSSCRYTIVAPSEYQVRATCSINLSDPSNGSCSSERFYFATDGRKDLSTSVYYCGAKTIGLTSQGNQMVLAYISTVNNGIFDCSITTVCDCGWSISSRIVGGTTAGVNEFTPMAALVDTYTYKIYCGATIVSSKYVVTAAHCLKVTTPSNTTVLVGDHNIKTGNETNYAAVYIVKRFVPKTDYSPTTNLNDIGLVETVNPILWSRGVSPVCLPFYYTSADFSGTTLTATGWGSTSFGGPVSDVLLKVDLNVLSNTNAQCTSTYPNVASSQMCTYSSQKDTCQRDSGGPLFYRGPTDPRLFLVGLVSLGEGCGGSNPSLNSRLTSFLTWIESITGTGVLCRRALA